MLNYLEEEGQTIEPDYYLPIVPLSLVNGAEGIGTGWSTCIPCFCPRDIVANLKRMMSKEPYQVMFPWYKGYIGSIEQKGESRDFTVRGVYRVLEEGGDELEITELPIGKWTRDYKNFLEELATKDEIDEIKEYHTENKVHFVLKVPKLQEIIAGEGIEKKFKLTTSISANNYVLFDYEGKIKRYPSEQEIIREFYVLRENLYHRRKDYLLARLRKEVEILTNKVRFILGVINEEIKVSRVKKRDIVKRLKQMGFKTMSEINEILPERKKPAVIAAENQLELADGERAEEEEKLADGEVPSKEYDYLLTM